MNENKSKFKRRRKGLAINFIKTNTEDNLNKYLKHCIAIRLINILEK